MKKKIKTQLFIKVYNKKQWNRMKTILVPLGFEFDEPYPEDFSYPAFILLTKRGAHYLSQSGFDSCKRNPVILDYEYHD